LLVSAYVDPTITPFKYILVTLEDLTSAKWYHVLATTTGPVIRFVLLTCKFIDPSVAASRNVTATWSATPVLKSINTRPDSLVAVVALNQHSTVKLLVLSPSDGLKLLTKQSPVPSKYALPLNKEVEYSVAVPVVLPNGLIDVGFASPFVVIANALLELSLNVEL